MRFKYFNILIICTLIIFILSIHIYGGVSTTSGNFLKIGATSRQIGMGEAFTAIADDPSALSVNPAGLGNIKNLEILFSHYEWITDLDYEYFAIAKPSFNGIKGFKGVLGGSITYLHLPPFYHYNDWGERVGELTVSGLAITLGYGQELENFMVGNSLKMVYEQIDDISDFAFGIDLGIIYTVKLPHKRISGFNLKGKSVKFGVSLLNIGIDNGIRGYDLPTTLKFGIGSKIASGLLVDMDIEKPFHNRVRINLGVEYTIKELFSVRAGYRFMGYKVDTFTLGLGIKYPFGGKLVKVGTAYAPQGPLENTTNFTIDLKFTGAISLRDWERANLLYYKGIYYYTRGELDKAVELWKEVLKIVPDHQKAKQKLKDAAYLKKLKEIEKK